MDSQVNHLFKESEIFQHGESKHEFKASIREEFEEEGKTCTWRELGDQMPIFSFKTAETYKEVWHQAGNFLKAEGSLKNIEKIDDSQIKSFIKHKIDDCGVSHSTAKVYIASMEKLEMALNMYAEKTESGNNYEFKLDDMRSYANENCERFDGSRAFENPAKVVDSLDGQSQLIASVQYESGCRVNEVISLKEENLIGNNTIRLTNTKGGLPRDVTVSPETYQKVSERISDNNGKFCEVSEKKGIGESYRADLKEVCSNLGENYSGSHSFRWNFAQESFNEKLDEGKSVLSAKKEVSEEMGHHRADITDHYLK